MSYSVYCHTNMKNGKRYFGITCQPVSYRWRGGLGYTKGAFHNAIVKYGWNGFTHEVLFSGLSEDEAKAKEKQLIAKYRTNEKAYGYNITEGGDGTSGFIRPLDQRLAMSESRKGRHAGSKNPMYGKRGEQALHFGIPMSEDAKQLAGDAIRLRHEQGCYDSTKKSVVAENATGFFVFPSIADAERATGIKGSNISRVCVGKRKTAGGYVWRYVE